MRVAFLFPALLLTCQAFAQAEDVTMNGDFEEVEMFSTENSHFKSMTEKNWTLDKPLRVPKGWCPNSGSATEGVFRLTEDRALAHSGEVAIHLKGDCYQTLAIPARAGDKVTLTFWAKADAGSSVSGILYAYAKESSGGPIPLGDSLNFSGQVGAEWAELTHTFDIPAELNGKTVVEVNAALRSYTGATLDDVSVTITRP